MHVLATSFQWVQQDIHLKIIWIWTNGKVQKAQTGNYKTEVKIADFRSGPKKIRSDFRIFFGPDSPVRSEKNPSPKIFRGKNPHQVRSDRTGQIAGPSHP